MRQLPSGFPDRYRKFADKACIGESEHHRWPGAANMGGGARHLGRSTSWCRPHMSSSSDLKRYLPGPYHGVSRACLQKCIDGFMFRFNRRRPGTAAAQAFDSGRRRSCSCSISTQACPEAWSHIQPLFN